MGQPVIVSATRTAVGKFGGGLKDMPATKIGAVVVNEAIRRAGILPGDVEECIRGNGVAGGSENMSRAPYPLEKARFGYKMFDSQMVDSMVRDGLWDVFNNFHMGNTGEIIAQRNNITRADADKFSLWSHQKAVQAIKSGAFKAEIVDVELPGKTKTVFSQDEGPREDTTLEALSKLKPVFRPDGVLTAGNSSSINDGASALVVPDSDYAKEKGIKPLARIVDYVTTGTKPELLMEAPISA